jgi:hypothetical protein
VAYLEALAKNPSGVVVTGADVVESAVDSVGMVVVGWG